MKTVKKVTKSDLDNWIKLVHCGDCCGMKDPLEEERDAFVKKILSQTKSKLIEIKNAKQAA